MTLADLIFWSRADNETGLPNITGTELAALINAGGGGPSVQVGLGCAVQRAPSVIVPDGFPGLDVSFTGAPNPFYDDLGFFNPAAPTLLTIPNVTPPILRVMLIGQLVWSGSIATVFEGSIQKGGGTFLEGHQSVDSQSGGTALTQYINMTKPPTDVVAGDTFTLRAMQTSTPAAAQTLARGQLTILVVK